jgi:RNase P protein component
LPAESRRPFFENILVSTGVHKGSDEMRPLANFCQLTAICVILALPVSAGDTQAASEKKRNQRKVASVKVDQSSPQTVAKSFQEAAAKKDWKAMFACMTKETQQTLTVVMMFASGFSTLGNKDKEQSLHELMKKHGLDPKKKPGLKGDPIAGVKDRAAFFGDLVQWLEKNSPKPEGGKPRKSFSDQIASLKIANFKINGATATADAIRNGKKTGEPLEFKKIDGKWYVHMEPKGRRLRAKKPPE